MERVSGDGETWGTHPAYEGEEDDDDVDAAFLDATLAMVRLVGVSLSWKRRNAFCEQLKADYRAGRPFEPRFLDLALRFLLEKRAEYDWTDENLKYLLDKYDMGRVLVLLFCSKAKDYQSEPDEDDVEMS
nr:MAG: hypothetical protein [Agrocybe praecox orthocurvulavirus 1]